MSARSVRGTSSSSSPAGGNRIPPAPGGVTEIQYRRAMESNRRKASMATTTVDSAALQADMTRRFNLGGVERLSNNRVGRRNNPGQRPPQPPASSSTSNQSSALPVVCGSCNSSNNSNDQVCAACGYFLNSIVETVPTLAQKRGLVPMLPKREALTPLDWHVLELNIGKRSNPDSNCPICMEGFTQGSEVLLSCSHIFHKQCLRSFENFMGISGGEFMCPICRTKNYQKKVTMIGSRSYERHCAVTIQQLWRGAIARKLYRGRLRRYYRSIKPNKVRTSSQHHTTNYRHDGNEADPNITIPLSGSGSGSGGSTSTRNVNDDNAEEEGEKDEGVSRGSGGSGGLEEEEAQEDAKLQELLQRRQQYYENEFSSINSQLSAHVEQRSGQVSNMLQSMDRTILESQQLDVLFDTMLREREQQQQQQQFQNQLLYGIPQVTAESDSNHHHHHQYEDYGGHGARLGDGRGGEGLMTSIGAGAGASSMRFHSAMGYADEVGGDYCPEAAAPWSVVYQQALSRCPCDCAICMLAIHSSSSAINTTTTTTTVGCEKVGSNRSSNGDSRTSSTGTDTGSGGTGGSGIGSGGTGTGGGIARRDVVLSCAHIFHENCIANFEKFSTSTNMQVCCPVCRSLYSKRLFRIRHNI